MDKGSSFAPQLVVLNPVWANIVAADYPKVEDVQAELVKYARIRIEEFPSTLQPVLESKGKVRDGHVCLLDAPDDVSLVVAGGMGSLHAAMLPGMSHTLPVTRSLDASTWAN
jgi:hypothetical protein